MVVALITVKPKAVGKVSLSKQLLTVKTEFSRNNSIGTAYRN